MKILILSSSDIRGGAARSAYRLHKALLSAGVESQMLVQSKLSDDFTVITEEGKLSKFLNLLRPYLDAWPVRRYKNTNKTLFSSNIFGFSGVVDKIKSIKPDIVHLHWVSGGMLRIEDINEIKFPLVWSMHDDWVFTGGCHIKWDCSKYINNCGACPSLGSNIENDLSRKVWRRKSNIFSKKNIRFIGLSDWLTQCAKKSSLLKNNNITNLPNPIDTNLYAPADKAYSRKIWNLPSNKKLILFGANSAVSDINKGFRELKLALDFLKTQDIELVIFGSSKPRASQNFGFNTHYLGHLNDDVSLISLYSAVDVLVVPSLQENLSNVIMEALACATPVVAFNVGGNSDLINHENNGYLAKPYISEDLAKGIDWILKNSNYEKICRNAREKVVNCFNEKLVAQKYIDFYEKIISEKNGY